MALKVTLNEPNGLALTDAILVVTSLFDNNQNSAYRYNASPSNVGDGSFVVNVDEKSNRNAQYQVSVWASEAILRAGQPPAGFLYNAQGQSQFQITVDDTPPVDRLAQAYAELLVKYPTALSVDLTDLGL